MLSRNVFNLIKGYFPNLASLLRLARNHFVKPITISRNGAKRALICYLKEPFLHGTADRHSNLAETLLIEKIVHKLGYATDVVDHDSEFPIDYSVYDLVLGFGNSFNRSFGEAKPTCIRVLHMTTAHVGFSNYAEACRGKYFNERNNFYLKPRREIYWHFAYSTINADAIFALGNSWSASTFDFFNRRVCKLPVPFVSPGCLDKTPDDIEKGRYSLLWFGGHGALHKGLDLCIEAIDRLGKNYKLTICGPIDYEADFFNFYELLFEKNKSIKFCGFVDIKSDDATELFKSHSFVIMPSCSEGGGSSVVSCMSVGMIPIVTSETSIPTENVGFEILEATVESVMEAIENACLTPLPELVKRSNKAKFTSIDEHSYDVYEKEFERSLRDVLKYHE